MPSKGKKHSRPSPSAVDRSPISRASSTPIAESRDDGGGDEAIVRQRLSEAAAKFPALISESAFCGRISDSDSSHSKGNQATVWLSEASMVSSSLVPSSLVSVSLATLGKDTFNNCPLDPLGGEYVGHFDIDLDDCMVGEAGCYFAIATVFPSRKVLKNGVRLSWGLSCTMGFPSMGRTLFVSSISSLSSSHHFDKTSDFSYIDMCKCKDLYLNMVPQKAGLITSVKELSTGNISTGNGKVASPKTPSSQSRLSSLGVPPSHLRKPCDFSSNLSSSLCRDTSAARLALEDEKVNELLQTYAARWLNGRHLLNKNYVTIPICGELCVFRVEGAKKLPAGHSNHHSTFDRKYDVFPHASQYFSSIDVMEIALLVDTTTNIHLSDSMSAVKNNTDDADFLARDSVSSSISNKEAGHISRLGGLSKEFAALKEIIMFSLANKGTLPRYKGVLLHGPPGTGKTSLASSCARDAGACLLSVNGPEIVSQYYGESEQALREVFDSARKAAPALVFIDELDAIAPTRKDGGEELSLRMVAALLKLMDEINRDDGILVIAATNRPDSIDPALRRPGRLDKEIEIGVPSPDQRLEILWVLVSDMDHSLTNSEIQSLAMITHGFVGADLAALCNEAAMTALRRHIKLRSSGSGVCKDSAGANGDAIDSLSLSLLELSVSSKPVCPASSQGVHEGVGTSGSIGEELLLKVTANDFLEAKMKVRPSAMREVMLELPKVRWEDVGGQNKVKQQLIEAVQWPQMYPDAFGRIGIRPSRGLLLIGPPGCSKTLMARAVASEAKLNFLAVKGPELFSKWVGESEKAVRSLFAKARANSPAIIFFDEIDGLATTRGQENDGTSVADRVLSQLLVEMDGLDQRIGVTVIAATNRPDKIDHALLRPGRFDRLLDVQPPDEVDREDIFRIHIHHMPCSSNVSTKELAQLTEGYTGADIKLICREAAVAALEESLDISEISMSHFKTGIGRVRRSDVQFYQQLAERFRRFVDTGGPVRDQ